MVTKPLYNQSTHYSGYLGEDAAPGNQAPGNHDAGY